MRAAGRHHLPISAGGAHDAGGPQEFLARVFIFGLESRLPAVIVAPAIDRVRVDCASVSTSRRNIGHVAESRHGHREMHGLNADAHFDAQLRASIAAPTGRAAVSPHQTVVLTPGANFFGQQTARALARVGRLKVIPNKAARSRQGKKQSHYEVLAYRESFHAGLV